MLDRSIRKPMFIVYRCNRGSWTEIYRTADESKACNEAERMRHWDAPTKVVSTTRTVIVDWCPACDRPLDECPADCQR